MGKAEQVKCFQRLLGPLSSLQKSERRRPNFEDTSKAKQLSLPISDVPSPLSCWKLLFIKHPSELHFPSSACSEVFRHGKSHVQSLNCMVCRVPSTGWRVFTLYWYVETGKYFCLVFCPAEFNFFSVLFSCIQVISREETILKQLSLQECRA